MAGRRDRGPSARRLVDRVEGRLGPLDRRLLLDEWRQTMGRPTPATERLRAQRRALLTAPGLLADVRAARSSARPTTVARRLELLERAILEAEIEQAPEIARRRDRLARRIGAFRPRWRGERVGRAVVRRAARTDPDRRVRERAFRAEEPLYRPMENELRTLVALRNERARALGFRSFPDFRLSLEGLSVPSLKALLDDALRYVPDEMRRRRESFEERTGERGWYPWDVGYAVQLDTGLPDEAFPGARMLPEVIAGVREWGFPARAFRFRVDRHDLASGGICLAPDPPRDVRVIVHPGGGWRSYVALFHEVGHALASGAIRQPTHLLRWHEHLPGFAGISEGEGHFFEQIASSEAWLRARPGLDRGQVDRALPAIRRAPLMSIAYLATWTLRELALYERPAADADDVGRRLARRVFGYDDHEPLSFVDAFSVDLPFYAPSYVYAFLLCPQLTAAALAEVGGALWPNPRIARWLVDRWFRDGSSYDWWVRLREVSGRPFGARAFNDAVRGLPT
ncbi:MAG TPA: hypothetical protein VMG36_04795 [Thermoplasmata archaeon]|nr:hypothetical protein [Thermoplasmata archaeon]